MSTDTITISLPKIVRAEDYHDFGSIQKLLRDVTNNPRIRVSEVGFDRNSGMYLGVIYTGKISREQVIKLVKSDKTFSITK